MSGQWTGREQRAATLVVFGCSGGSNKVSVAGGAIQLVAAAATCRATRVGTRLGRCCGNGRSRVFTSTADNGCPFHSPAFVPLAVCSARLPALPSLFVHVRRHKHQNNGHKRYPKYVNASGPSGTAWDAT